MRAIHAWSGAVVIAVSVLAVSSAYLTPPAQAAPSGHTLPAQSPPAKPTTPRGSVGAAMPAAAVSQTDGLPAVLVDGRTYRLTLHVGVAGGQPSTWAQVLLDAANRSVCLTERLPSGVISVLRCTFVPADLGQQRLQIKVLLGSAHGGQVVASFDHLVVKVASPE